MDLIEKTTTRLTEQRKSADNVNTRPSRTKMFLHRAKRTIKIDSNFDSRKITNLTMR